jgi:hypothetical protein
MNETKEWGKGESKKRTIFKFESRRLTPPSVSSSQSKRGGGS